jgi:tetratricopeptide (TPR) repeat protein
MGECKMQLEQYREAIQYFSNVVRQRPRNIFSWEALIRCLYNGEYYDEALEQVKTAMKLTDGKPIFSFYLAAVYLELGKSKEALLHLEKGMSKAPKMLKKLVDLNPSILQNQQVIEIVARYKRNRAI